ncbi:magnesium transporter CorA family protein [Lacisediminimonas profundi]|uniref:magnesium transporter CorA family protein n=1 Tax=Lacisediminimonas profundi TaxID=2603856 RepID=UPI00124B6532|nr:magnesium transporter CorA family protein [Lacisediminimonas profundi]
MDAFLVADGQAKLLSELPVGLPSSGFYWLDFTHDEVQADPEHWRDLLQQATGIQVYDPHLTDAVNLRHPSYFDATHDYYMLVFRKLLLGGTEAAQEQAGERRLPPAVSKLSTVPVTFLLLDRALVTVHAAGSRTVEMVRAKLLDQRPRGSQSRLPQSAQELMLRLLNAMVDQYLDLRQPLSNQIDRWQRTLLNPRRQFNNWMSLLDARVELRRLEHLCEEQHDALQELRDHFVDNLSELPQGHGSDLLLVRINDLMEHVTRVLNHARRLESSIETAVQIHFAAMAHRTSEIMRMLTVITALFMPLTLITGIFGMNFIDMPLLREKQGFWMAIGIMAVVVVVLLFLFRRQHYLDDGPDPK